MNNDVIEITLPHAAAQAVIAPSASGQGVCLAFEAKFVAKRGEHNQHCTSGGAMLCDDWLTYFDKLIASGDPRAAKLVDFETFQPILLNAQRLVIGPDAERVVRNLVDAVDHERFEAARAACVAPGASTWVEWHCSRNGLRIGVLLRSRERAPVSGDGLLVINARNLHGVHTPVHFHIDWDLNGPGPIIAMNVGNLDFATFERAFPGLSALLEQEYVAAFLLVALTLILTPRIAERRAVDFETLNRKRRKAGRAALLDYSEITLDIDATSRVAIDVATSGCEGRARHHVRAHYRLLPGKVSLVRPHLRGDPARGVIKQTHHVRARGKAD